MLKKIIETVLGIFVIAIIFWYGKSHRVSINGSAEISKGSTHSVILTKDGFTPSEITIKQGDTVTFSTQLTDSFWPASDPHPTHEIYPEFDPKQPIEAGKSWSFVFTRIGSWKYHDHLFFTYRGVVNVIAAGEISAPAIICDKNSQTPQCWDEKINSALKDKGLDEAFNIMDDLYQNQPGFAQSCHGYAHTLGQEAFKLFSLGKDVELSSKTSYCGYGFYHGFMESLLHTTGDIQQAKDFCAYVGKKLLGQTTDAEGACYHGIGHGAVDGGDPTAWGNVEKMMEPSMKLCQSVAGDDTSRFGKLYRCVSGAYNAIEILSQDPKYNLTAIQKDPFYLCPSQKPSFYEACYTNMLPALMRFTNGDFVKSAKAIQAIQNDSDYSLRSQVMLSLFHEWIRVNLNKPDYGVAEAVKICRSLSSQMRLPCIEGLSGGHMKYGQPQQEYVKALNFCALKILQHDEQQTCYSYILPRLRVWYSPQKTQEICMLAPTEYQKFCRQAGF